ncbi:MAG TPA: hypothetical protein PLO41_23115 [Rubrivivax sp.]|nr:hypothetical protein [Rubrivivax sp.]
MKRPIPRGVSLIEAIVAMAVMAFGMVAIVGLQGTLRQNSDIAKQRSEAVRLAQAAIEDWRRFAQMGLATPPDMGYTNIQTTAAEVISPDSDNRHNTTFTRTRTVTDVPGGKSIAVTVTWPDRTRPDQNLSVTLSSIIARVDPALSGILSMNPGGGATLPPLGRHHGIPQGALPAEGNKSVFKPPGSDGTMAWVFDNVTGVIVGVCNSLTAGQNPPSDVSSCLDYTKPGVLLSGFVRFATGPNQPTATDAEHPTGTALNFDVTLALTSTGHPIPPVCYANAPTSASTTLISVPYHCVIFFNAGPTLRWSGMSALAARPFLFDLPTDYVPWALADNAADARASRFRVCRYTPATSDAQQIPNALHPRNYSNVGVNEPLTNQNFLVIRAGDDPGDGTGTAFTCPTDVPADPASGNFVNSNTLPHQPPPPAPP